MKAVRGGSSSGITTGSMITVLCEGGVSSTDVVFYKAILGSMASIFEFKPIGSSNVLLEIAANSTEIKNLIGDGFCLIDKDFRTDAELTKMEKKTSLKVLRKHEIENFLLDTKYLKQLEYIKRDVDIDKEINKIIESKKIRFLADFLQFKINNHLAKFPRISKLSKSDLPSDKSIVVTSLLKKLDDNYNNVDKKVIEIKDKYINIWEKDFESLSIDELPGKDIFKELKNKIFNQPPQTSDIAKHIAKLMQEDSYMPSCLKVIFTK